MPAAAGPSSQPATHADTATLAPPPDAATRHEVTQLLHALEPGGDPSGRLFELVYAELRLLASSHLRRERRDHTLQATALVHEAYLRLVDQRNVTWQNRSHFFAVAARMMRRILVNHARDRNRLKRGGGAARVPLDEGVAATGAVDLDLEALDEALERLAALDERKVRVVEMRYFAGMSIEETADALNVSPATVKREWTLARAWLKSQIDGTTAPADGDTEAGDDAPAAEEEATTGR